MFVTDSLYLKNDQPEEKNQMHNDSATNISNLSTTNIVTNIIVAQYFAMISIGVNYDTFVTFHDGDTRSRQWMVL